jgi:hypothetical protein
VDRAIGAMARSLSRAVDAIDRLIERGETDAVKLAAAQALIDSVSDVGRHAELKAEVRQLIATRLDS